MGTVVASTSSKSEPKPEVAAPAPAPAAPTTKLVVGDRMLLRAVYGRLIHPYQVPLEFNTDVATPVTVDGWVVTQFEAGKLAIAAP